MAVSISNLTNGEDSDGGSSSTTASVTPSSNALELLTVYSRTGISTNPNQPTVTGNSLTWVAIATVIYDDSSSSRRRITLFRALGASPSSGTITIDFGGQAQTDVGWSLDQATGTDTSGTNGSGAIVQSATNLDTGTSSTSLTVTLSAFGDSNNATFGAFSAGGSEVQTVGSGFTQLSNRVLASANISGLTEWKTANDTSVDYTVAAGEQMGGIAIEIKMAAAAVNSNFLAFM